MAERKIGKIKCKKSWPLREGRSEQEAQVLTRILSVHIYRGRGVTKGDCKDRKNYLSPFSSLLEKRTRNKAFIIPFARFEGSLLDSSKLVALTRYAFEEKTLSNDRRNRGIKFYSSLSAGVSSPREETGRLIIRDNCRNPCNS